MKKMNFREKAKRSNLAEELKKRNEESKNSITARFGNIYNNELKVPVWRCIEGVHVLDVVPFYAGKQHPKVAEDKVTYWVDVHVHTNVGPAKKQYVCPAWNWSNPCPICEYVDDNRGKLSKEDWSKARAKRKAIYLVHVLTSAKDKSVGLQVFEIAHFLMEEKLDAIKKSPLGGGSVVLGNPDTSPYVVFERKGTGYTNTQYLGHRWEKRDTPMSDAILDSTFPLDEIINMHPDYDEIYTAFHGTSTKEKVAEPEPVQEETSFVDNDEEDGDDDVINDDQCPGGGKYGINTEELDHCNTCEIYDDCAATLTANSAPATPEPAPAHRLRSKRLRR